MTNRNTADDILELPPYNPYREQVIGFLTELLVDATEDRLLSFFAVGERPDKNTTMVCWTAAVDDHLFDARILKNALMKIGLTDADAVREIIDESLSL